MSIRNKYQKLNLGPSGNIGRKSVVGFSIIADYIDHANGQRTLVLERPERTESIRTMPVRKKKTPNLDLIGNAG